jgi:CBS domain containing-hemolysin-like protein
MYREQLGQRAISSPIFRSSLVIWKRSPQGHGYVKAWISSFHSMSSISTSSYDILLSAPGSCLFRLSATQSLVNLWHIATLCLCLSLFLVFLSLCNTLTYQSMASCHPLSLSLSLSLSPTANLQNNIIPGSTSSPE